jgi:thiol-disulfide isomerase/thioredoxin
MIDFWATYCKPCRAEMPQLVKLQQRLQAKGVRLVTVSADEPEAEARAKQFLKEAGAAAVPAYWKRAKDDDKFFGIVDPKWDGAMPALFLYDKSGRKARSFFGESPLAEVEAAIQKLL